MSIDEEMENLKKEEELLMCQFDGKFALIKNDYCICTHDNPIKCKYATIKINASDSKIMNYCNRWKK